MTSLEDLKNVLKETLDHRGVLNQIRARVRAEVFSALDNQTTPAPVLSNENLFINELIREYFEFNKYKYTTAVLLSESGQPKDAIDRRFLQTELNLTETRSSEQLPILYSLVSHFLEQRDRDQIPEKDDSTVPSGASVMVKVPTGLSPQRRRKISDCSVEENDSVVKNKGIVYHAIK